MSGASYAPWQRDRYAPDSKHTGNPRSGKESSITQNLESRLMAAGTERQLALRHANHYGASAAELPARRSQPAAQQRRAARMLHRIVAFVASLLPGAHMAKGGVPT